MYVVDCFNLWVGAVGGRWICKWLAVLLRAPSPPQSPPATSKNLPSFIASLLLFSFCVDGSNQHSIRTAGGKPISLRSEVERATFI